MVWMYDCGSDFKICTGDKQGWFKIDQMGLWGNNLNSEDWGTAIVLKQLKWSSKIPKNLKPGNYLVRHELLALHQANTPQFYAECAQVVVEGSGTAQPPSSFLKSIPGYAPQNDPGITVSGTCAVFFPDLGVTLRDRSTYTMARQLLTRLLVAKYGPASNEQCSWFKSPEQKAHPFELIILGK